MMVMTSSFFIVGVEQKFLNFFAAIFSRLFHVSPIDFPAIFAESTNFLDTIQKHFDEKKTQISLQNFDPKIRRIFFRQKNENPNDRTKFSKRVKNISC